MAIELPASDSNDAVHMGSLNICSYSAPAFDPSDESVMWLFTTAASAAISNAHQRQRSREHIGNLETALASRAVIEQAKRILMAVHACTADQAFELLVQQSQHNDVRLRDVARHLHGSVAGR
ncbi:ANTAR domain-containing protein [Lentzea sp. NPDC042327]|uniref:ANTAR domain-containing response regulator n=1 Tax=Lentzea sp. NPDC042327 TaxID=3154801 RepID=UPI003408832E